MTPPPPPPPPPPVPVATTLAIQAGDNQTAGAGTRVAVPPSVIVKDQNGAAMSGVAVTFAVDSGGGAVTNATATTASDGTASSGGWQLGLGRNRLRATAGTLTPVFFTATATGELTLADTTVSSDGGTITVRRPGTPIDSLQLVIPRGAATSGTRFTVTAGDSTGAPRPRGFRAASPVISITTSAPLVTRVGPVRVSLPGAAAAGDQPIALFFNRTTGEFVSAPAVVSQGRLVTLAPTLDASTMATNGTVLQRALAANNPGIQMVIGAVQYQDLTRDISTGYNPAVDNWDFTLEGSNVANQTQGFVGSGMALGAAWYFSREKGQHGALNGKFQRRPGVEPSNERGQRMAWTLASEMDLSGPSAYTASLASLGQLVNASEDSLLLLVVKSHMYLTGQPYPLLGAEQGNADHFASVLVYGARGNTLDVTLGGVTTGNANTLSLVNGDFSALPLDVVDTDTRLRKTFTLNVYSAGGPTLGFAAARLQQLFQDLHAGTIGASLPWAGVDVVTWGQRPVRDTLWIPDDSTWVWLECRSSANCPYGYQVTGPYTPVNKVAGGSLFRQDPGGPWRHTGTAIYGRGLALKDDADGVRVGLAHFTTMTPNAQAGTRSAGYVGWSDAIIKTRRMTVTPSPLVASGGYDFTMTANYARPTPSRATWRWQLGDGRTVNTTQNTLTTRYPVPTDTAVYRVKVTMLVDTVVEATARTTVIVKKPRFTWRMQAASVQATTLPPGGIGNQRSDTAARNLATQLITNLTTTPANTGLFVEGIANATATCDAGAILQQFPAGQFSDTAVTNIIPMALLGSCGDPGWTGSLVLGPLGSGTLVGSAADVPNPNEILLPGGSINATMASRTLTGTFVMNVRYSTGIGTYRVAFTATQVRP